MDFQNFNFTYERISIEQNGAHIFVFQPKASMVPLSSESLKEKDVIKKHPLTIAYLLPHKNLTGGMKMLLQQMKYLRQKGHKIIACLKNTDDRQSVPPQWFDLEVDQEISVPRHKKFMDYITECDVIVAGWVTQLMELEECSIPVMYWEQGNEWVFGDISHQKNVNTVIKILEQCYLTKHTILSVSPYVANTIQARYGRKTDILTNGIDIDFYCMGEKSNTNKILLVGNSYLWFKGFELAFKALYLAWAAGYRFHVEWVCQTTPCIPNMPFPIEIIIQPTQEKLVACYQEADIYLFTSWYEGFGMPPLEAMACGTPVVCTQCGGIDSFVRNGYNALTSESGDITTMTANIISLIKFPYLRKELSKNGRSTAKRLDYSKTIPKLEKYLYAITSTT